MRHRGGVRSTIDVGRLAAAVARPGIDPRRWIEIGRVQDVGYDKDLGLFADVTFLPEGDTETCLVASPMAGADFGFLQAPKVGDLVVVAFPQGNQANGPVIIGRIWNGMAPPPEEFKDPDGSEDTDVEQDTVTVVEPSRTFKLVARKGSSINLIVDGDGDIEITATGNAQVKVTSEKAIVVDSPDVKLGDAPGNQVARIGDMVVGGTPKMQVVTNSSSGTWFVDPVPGTGSPTASGGIPIVGQIVSGAKSVKA